MAKSCQIRMPFSSQKSNSSSSSYAFPPQRRTMLQPRSFSIGRISRRRDFACDRNASAGTQFVPRTKIGCPFTRNPNLPHPIPVSSGSMTEERSNSTVRMPRRKVHASMTVSPYRSVARTSYRFASPAFRGIQNFASLTHAVRFPSEWRSGSSQQKERSPQFPTMRRR